MTYFPTIPRFLKIFIHEKMSHFHVCWGDHYCGLRCQNIFLKMESNLNHTLQKGLKTLLWWWRKYSVAILSAVTIVKVSWKCTIITWHTYQISIVFSTNSYAFRVELYVTCQVRGLNLYHLSFHHSPR